MLKKSQESYTELIVRQQDLLSKWTKDCMTVEELSEMIVMEQFINMVSADVRL